jgi:hypothetical protein
MKKGNEFGSYYVSFSNFPLVFSQFFQKKCNFLQFLHKSRWFLGNLLLLKYEKKIKFGAIYVSFSSTFILFWYKPTKMSFHIIVSKKKIIGYLLKTDCFQNLCRFNYLSFSNIFVIFTEGFKL